VPIRYRLPPRTLSDSSQARRRVLTKVELPRGTFFDRIAFCIVFSLKMTHLAPMPPSRAAIQATASERQRSCSGASWGRSGVSRGRRSLVGCRRSGLEKNIFFEFRNFFFGTKKKICTCFCSWNQKSAFFIIDYAWILARFQDEEGTLTPDAPPPNECPID